MCHSFPHIQELCPESFPHTVMWVKGGWEVTPIQHLQRNEVSCYWEQKARCVFHWAPLNPTELSSLLRDLIPGSADAKAVDKEKSRVQNSHTNSSVTVNHSVLILWLCSRARAHCRGLPTLKSKTRCWIAQKCILSVWPDGTTDHTQKGPFLHWSQSTPVIN